MLTLVKRKLERLYQYQIKYILEQRISPNIKKSFHDVKGVSSSEDITILIIYVPNNRASDY